MCAPCITADQGEHMQDAGLKSSGAAAPLAAQQLSNLSMRSGPAHLITSSCGCQMRSTCRAQGHPHRHIQQQPAFSC